VSVQRSATVAKRARSALSRSKPACYLCGAAIDYTLPYSDPKSFVVDHVIPLHKGGTDTLDNMKAAHRDCNSTKRARLIAPIVRRSGSLD